MLITTADDTLKYFLFSFFREDRTLKNKNKNYFKVEYLFDLGLTSLSTIFQSKLSKTGFSPTSTFSTDHSKAVPLSQLFVCALVVSCVVSEVSYVESCLVIMCSSSFILLVAWEDCLMVAAFPGYLHLQSDISNESSGYQTIHTICQVFFFFKLVLFLN